MSAKTKNLLWYTCYGSNMNRDRFLCYILGGTPRGAMIANPGCGDKSLPLSERQMELPGQLYFASESSVWAGGDAFISHDREAGNTKAKAYLITTEQFAQIVMQENGDTSVPDIDYEALKHAGHLRINKSEYDDLLYFGECEGHPVVSFTQAVDATQFTKPSLPYLRVIASGLRETYAMTTADIADYLMTKPGIAGNYSYSQLTDSIADRDFVVLA